MKNIIKVAQVEKPTTLNEQEIYQGFKHLLLTGKIEPLKVFFYVRMFSKAAELLNKDAETKTIMQNALERHDKQNLYGFGVTVSYRKDYDYLGTGSIYYQKLKAEEKALKEKIKAYEDFLENVDSETTNEKEEGVILKPITFTRMKIISIGKPFKDIGKAA